MSDDNEQYGIDLAQVKCPYCGYNERDAWECVTHKEDNEVECESCGKIFILHRNINYDVLRCKP